MKLAQRLAMAQRGDDPYGSDVVLLVQPPLDSVDNSTAITDLSSYARTVSVAGNTKIRTNLEWPSVYFDGSGDIFTLPYDPIWNLQDQDFTLEIVMPRPTTSRTFHRVCGQRAESGNYGWMIYFSAGSVSYYQWTASSVSNYCGVTAPATGVLVYLQLNRFGNECSIAVNNGTPGSFTSANRPAALSNPLTFGRGGQQTNDYLLGNIFAARLTWGVARPMGAMPDFPFPTS